MIDLASLWDFDDPAGSEARFRAAADATGGTERAVLETQVARALGLQGRYDDGHAVLDGIDDEAAEVEVRLALERGRLHNSAGSPAVALDHFRRAADLALVAGLPALRIDALHMVAIAAPPPERVALNREALAEARASSDPDARRWERSLLNNLGVELAEAGELDEAHAVLVEALEACERAGDLQAARIGRWMVGWVLRLQGRHSDARAVQEALRGELAAAGLHDPYVDEELALLDAADSDEGA
jgi:tetratricopeptide (TPR) repeat protein